MLEKNKSYEIEITDLTVEGMGIGRVQGMAVFVNGMLPGEAGRVKIIRCAKKYAIAIPEEITRTSPERVEPPCPVFRPCGGCTLQHLSYFGQLQFKHDYVQNCIQKLAKLNAPVLFPLPARQQWGYRNKTAFPVGPGPEGVQIGCYARHSHRIVECDQCLLQDPEANACIAAVREWMNTFQIPAYDEISGTGAVRHVVVRSTSLGDKMAAIVSRERELPHLKELVRLLRTRVPAVMSILLNYHPQPGNVILGEETQVLFGTPKLDEVLQGLTFSISLHTFLQVHHAQAELLYNTVFKLARIQKEDTVADLYCGAGTMTLAAARRAKWAYGVEIVPQAVEDARENAANNGIQNASFLLGDAKDAFPVILQEAGHLDVVIVDPPRKGLDLNVIEDICNCPAKRLVYVSCDPATLARDVAVFVKKGFRIQVVQPVDLFPQTTHVETCVLLSR